jgi:hypothetical protein
MMNLIFLQKKEMLDLNILFRWYATEKGTKLALHASICNGPCYKIISGRPGGHVS